MVRDRVAFIYDRMAPLVNDENEYARLVRQIKGGPDEMPLLKDLVFQDEYRIASRSSVRVRTSSSSSFFLDLHQSILVLTSFLLVVPYRAKVTGTS